VASIAPNDQIVYDPLGLAAQNVEGAGHNNGFLPAWSTLQALKIEDIMKVFLAGTSLQPDYGGPAFSVSRLAIALAEAGAEIALWAPDQSAATTPLLPAKSPVQRLTGTEAEALDRFGKIDLLHDNGIWLPHNHRLAVLAARRGIPRVVSTRGMLEPWAMKHKKWKKRCAWWLYQRSDLKRARCHHSTAETEARNVQRLGLDVPVYIIPNGVDIPELHLNVAGAGQKKHRCGHKTALFVGRIHPKKGLPMLIEAWARVRPDGWLLQIAGSDATGHRVQVEKAVLAADLNKVISFVGPIEGKKKQSVFFNADLFVLPTYSENFGIVIAEALAHGVPVLTTTGAPWSMLLERDCGWWVEPTVDDIAEGLRQATSCDSETLRAMGAKGREWVRGEFGWCRIANKFLETYEGVLTNKVC
jgi:glycosyltransferase involved in cell wall biosynthesis